MLGTGSVAGEALVRHPDVDVVSFTGSTRIGRHVAALAADRVARACLELGGKSPSVVLPDADLERAVQGTVDSATSDSGQTCSALTRLLVPQARLDDAIDIAVARAGQLVVGDPRADGTDFGPLISARQRRRVVGFLERALAAGARLAAGHAAHTPPAKRGHYVEPCIVADAERDSEIVQEEVFGPVLCASGRPPSTPPRRSAASGSRASGASRPTRHRRALRAQVDPGRRGITVPPAPIAWTA